MDEKDLKQEPGLDLEEVKDLTVGQAMRKNEEIEAGVTPEDSILDKYIKQHRAEIEAEKFETKILQTPLSQDKELASSEHSQEILDEEIPSLKFEEETVDTISGIQSESHPVVEPIGSYISSEELDSAPAPLPFYKKKWFLYPLVGAGLLGLIGGSAYLALNRTQTKQTTSSSTKKSSSKETTTSSSKTSKLKEFNDLYDSFFTDANKLALKNSSFGDLDKLKTALEALKGTDEYTAAKAKYDSLVKQVSAVQAVNSQFESPAIVDGVLDTAAKAKSEVNFSEESTGNSDLDKVIKSAISLGRSQQVASPAPQTATTEVTAQVPAVEVQTPTPATTEIAGSQATVAGLPVSPLPATANLQRNLSRVPYNQAAIDDVSNPAWVFNPGVLEKILETSRQRGYITGDNYIIERVNIINGNGYYNLFKPDGTYLFSINCKTGYFVGNAKGHADALDY